MGRGVAPDLSGNHSSHRKELGNDAVPIPIFAKNAVYPAKNAK
jgi:hypothetical protein